MISTITSKGQITIPVQVRRAAGLEAGTQVEFIVNARQRIELVPRQGDIRALRGAVPLPAAPVSVVAMSSAISAGWGGAPSSPDEARLDEPPSSYRVSPSPSAPRTRK